MHIDGTSASDADATPAIPRAFISDVHLAPECTTASSTHPPSRRRSIYLVGDIATAGAQVELVLAHPNDCAEFLRKARKGAPSSTFRQSDEFLRDITARISAASSRG